MSFPNTGNVEKNDLVTMSLFALQNDKNPFDSSFFAQQKENVRNMAQKLIDAARNNGKSPLIFMSPSY